MRGSRREGGGKATVENPRCIISGFRWVHCVCARFVFIRRINSSIVGFSVGCNVICYFGQILFHWINSNDCIIIVDYQNGLCWHYSKEKRENREHRAEYIYITGALTCINICCGLVVRLRYIFYALHVCECCAVDANGTADAGHLSHYLFINILVDFIEHL